MKQYIDEFGYNLRLALPIILSMLGHTLVGVIDTAMVGKVGTLELAAAVAIYQHYRFTALQQPLSNAAGHPAMNIWMIKSLLSDE